MTSPSVSDLLNAANWEYLQTGTPSANLTAFKVNGTQLKGYNEADGFSSAVWQDTATHQLVVGFEGTQAVDLNAVIADPNFTINQLKADISLLAGEIPKVLLDAFNFVVGSVEPAAAKQGYSTKDIFVTGHSLGADEAQFVAETTGLGGIAFEGSGISSSVHAVGDGSNFVSIVEYGDPFANYSSDIHIEQPYAPTFVAHGGALPHYGNIVMIGNPANEGALPGVVAAGIFFGPLGALLALGGDMLAFHQIQSQAYYLGVTLNETNSAYKWVGVQSGWGNWNVANDTGDQLVSYAKTQAGYQDWFGLLDNWTSQNPNLAWENTALSNPLKNPTPGASAQFGTYSGIVAQDIAIAEPAIDALINFFEYDIVDPLESFLKYA